MLIWRVKKNSILAPWSCAAWGWLISYNEIPSCHFLLRGKSFLFQCTLQMSQLLTVMLHNNSFSSFNQFILISFELHQSNTKNTFYSSIWNLKVCFGTSILAVNKPSLCHQSLSCPKFTFLCQGKINFISISSCGIHFLHLWFHNVLNDIRLIARAIKSWKRFASLQLVKINFDKEKEMKFAFFIYRYEDF